MKSDMTDFWAFAGKGLAIFFICVGIGTCTALSKKVDRIEQQPEKVEK